MRFFLEVKTVARERLVVKNIFKESKDKKTRKTDDYLID